MRPLTISKQKFHGSPWALVDREIPGGDIQMINPEILKGLNSRFHPSQVRAKLPTRQVSGETVRDVDCSSHLFTRFGHHPGADAPRVPGAGCNRQPARTSLCHRHGAHPSSALHGPSYGVRRRRSVRTDRGTPGRHQTGANTRPLDPSHPRHTDLAGSTIDPDGSSRPLRSRRKDAKVGSSRHLFHSPFASSRAVLSSPLSNPFPA